jgi:hypothetical protein
MIDKIAIEVTLFDSGCLPGLLGKEIAAVMRQQRINAGLTTEQAKDLELYRAQLSNCLAAVQIARSRPRADLAERCQDCGQELPIRYPCHEQGCTINCRF